jgi:ubiquitin conjugation factor E4 B
MSIEPNDASNAHLLDRGQLKFPLFDYLLNCWIRLEDVKLHTSRAKVNVNALNMDHAIHLELALLTDHTIIQL